MTKDYVALITGNEYIKTFVNNIYSPKTTICWQMQAKCRHPGSIAVALVLSDVYYLQANPVQDCPSSEVSRSIIAGCHGCYSASHGWLALTPHLHRPTSRTGSREWAFTCTHTSHMSTLYSHIGKFIHLIFYYWCNYTSWMTLYSWQNITHWLVLYC